MNHQPGNIPEGDQANASVQRQMAEAERLASKMADHLAKSLYNRANDAAHQALGLVEAEAEDIPVLLTTDVKRFIISAGATCYLAGLKNAVTNSIDGQKTIVEAIEKLEKKHAL